MEETPSAAMGREDLLWLLGSLCNLHRLPFDPDLIAGEFPPPHSLATFHEAARQLGFKTGGTAITGLAKGVSILPKGSHFAKGVRDI